MQITLKSNVGLVRQGLQDFAGEPIKIGRRQLRTVVDRIVREASAYPPEYPEPKRYVRTGNLYSSWRVVRQEDGYQILNFARRGGRSYTNYVIGDARGMGQTLVHASWGWPLFREVVDKHMETLPEPVAREIELVARRYLADKNPVTM